MKKHGGYPGFIPRKNAKRKEHNPHLQKEALPSRGKLKAVGKNKHLQKGQNINRAKQIKGETTMAPYGIAASMKHSINY